MANSTEQVPLPHSVEQLLDRICREQNQTPPDPILRGRLAEIGEEQAIQILTKISTQTIRKSLSAYIRYLIGPSAATSPNKAICLSPNATPGSTTRGVNPQDNEAAHFLWSCGLAFLTRDNFDVGNLIGKISAAATHLPVAEHPGSTLHLSSHGGEEISVNSALWALGELEFRKAFLLLSYIGGENLEQAITADKIRSLKELPMRKFEEEAWAAVGQKYLQERLLSLEWDSGKPYVYHCHIYPDGRLRFKGPFLQDTRTHLQKTLGDDNILIVKFAEERNGWDQRTSFEEAYDLYRKFGKEGIRVGLRLYRFFVFKDGGKNEKKKEPTTSPVKCYFVRMESRASMDKRDPYILSNKSMFEARSLFMHAHMLPSVDKFMARFSLILSKTLKLDVDFASVNVQTIEDEYCLDENGKIVIHNGEQRIHTDGTGFISEDLGVLCPKNVSEGRLMSKKSSKGISTLIEYDDTIVATGKAESSTSEPPLLIQCRLFHLGRAIKGTLLINKKLPPRTIQVRPSMIKVKTDPILLPQSINSMEIVGTSNKPKKAYLSKNLIALLSYGGVPNEFFMDILRSALEDADGVFNSKRAALRASVTYGEMDEYNVARMILSGIPLDEPYLQYYLSIRAKEEMKSLRGGKLHVPDCYYLMGTVDPTRCLKRNQVCIIHENGQISGDVLVYRNPGLHFGDIHILQATYVEELESYVGHSKYAIFFPCTGPRSLADEMAGGDFDGDMYWVSKNTQLLEYFRKSDPWMESEACNDVSGVKQPSALSPDEDELFRLFLDTRFHPSYSIGGAADSWAALMDRLLTLRDDCPKEKEEKERVKHNIIELVDIYYEALDAPKKGGRKVEVPKHLKAEIFPHYMEKENSYTSTSILGLIYDEVYKHQSEDISGKDIVKLSCFNVEIPENCVKMWEAYYSEYRRDMAAALKCDPKFKHKTAEEVITKYKEKLYDAAELENSPKNIEEIYNEALAVYHITYDYALSKKSVSKCGFAWKVAGSALVQLYTIKQGERVLTCVPSALREIFSW